MSISIVTPDGGLTLLLQVQDLQMPVDSRSIPGTERGHKVLEEIVRFHKPVRPLPQIKKNALS